MRLLYIPFSIMFGFLIRTEVAQGQDLVNEEKSGVTSKNLVVYFHGLFGNSESSQRQIEEIGIHNTSKFEFLTPTAEEIGYRAGTWYPLEPQEIEDFMRSYNVKECFPPLNNLISLVPEVVCNKLSLDRYKNFFNLFAEAYLKKIQAYLQHELKKRDLTSDHLILMGYSMGGIVAQHLALKMHAPCKAAIAINSLYIPIQKNTEPKKIFLCNNKNDQVVPIDLAKITYSILRSEADFNIEEYISLQDISHDIGNEERKKIKDWFNALN